MPDLNSMSRARCEIVLIQFLRAGRRLRPPREKEVDLDAVLREREVRLEALTAQARSWMRPAWRLADRLKLTEDEVSFLWATIAVAIQPALGIDGFDGAELDRGLSVDVWARVLAISHTERPLDLVMQLQSGRLVASGLIRAGRHGRTPYIPSRMVIEYLGDAEVSHARIEPRRPTSLDDLVTDAAQAAALGDLPAGRGTLTLVEGMDGSRRTTAIAAKTLGLLRCVDLWGSNAETIEAMLLDLCDGAGY